MPSTSSQLSYMPFLSAGTTCMVVTRQHRKTEHAAAQKHLHTCRFAQHCMHEAAQSCMPSAGEPNLHACSGAPEIPRGALQHCRVEAACSAPRPCVLGGIPLVQSPHLHVVSPVTQCLGAHIQLPPRLAGSFCSPICTGGLLLYAANHLQITVARVLRHPGSGLSAYAGAHAHMHMHVGMGSSHTTRDICRRFTEGKSALGVSSPA